MYAVSITFSLVRVGSEWCDRTADSLSFQVLRAWEARPLWATAAFEADVAFEESSYRPVVHDIGHDVYVSADVSGDGLSGQPDSVEAGGWALSVLSTSEMSGTDVLRPATQGSSILSTVGSREVFESGLVTVAVNSDSEPHQDGGGNPEPIGTQPAAAIDDEPLAPSVVVTPVLAAEPTASASQ
jgi:hypothetical protein